MRTWNRTASVAAASSTTRADDETRAIALVASVLLFGWSLVSGLLLWWNGVPGALDAARPHVALLVHLGFWIFYGELRGRRRATWLLLVVGAFAVQLTHVLIYVLPWGQVGYWMAARPVLGPLLRPFVEGSLAEIGPLLLALALPLLLALDLWVAHRGPGWRRAVGPVLAVIAIGHVALAATMAGACSEPDAFASVAELREQIECGARNAATLDLASPPLPPLATPAHVVPEWELLPGYSVLRAVSGKEAGVLAVIAVLLLPALAAWFGAERLRGGPTAPFWLGACLLLYAAWIALGWLGTRPAEEPYLLLSRVLTLYVFAFFLFVPFALHRPR